MKQRHAFLLIFLVFLILCYSFAEAASRNSTPDIIPPIVSITSPPTGYSFTSAVTVTIVATASDNVKVSKVEFYDNGVYKGYDPRTPYTFNWSITSAANGTHNWTAKAYDRAGNVATSSVVILNVNIDPADITPPSVSITSPLSGTTYTTAQTVTISASASDNVGITKVEFYDGATLKGTDTVSPYNYAWSFTGADNGTHNWTAKAYDAANNSSVSNTVSLIVSIDTTAPSVPTGLTATAVSCSQINLSWNASTDIGGSGLKGYNIYRNGSFLKQVATTSTTDTGLAASTTYSYSVSAIDNANNESGQSNSANATTPACPDTTPPSVSITSPPSGTTYTTAQTVTITASASDNVGVTKVEFYDGSVLKGTDTSAPYNYAWSFTGADNGTHNWTAKAYDAANNSSVSNTVSLIVNIDITAPSVPIGLTATAVSCSQINLSWNASTDTGGSGLKGYNVYRNGSFLKQVTTTSTSDTGLSASTNYSYSVSSIDNANNESDQSSSASETTPACPDTTPPSVSITSPANNTTYTTAQTVTITASASDNVGVTKVEFYDGTTLVATDTAFPYTYAWSFTSANNGTHNWTAKAYDAANNSSVSNVVSLIVNIDITPPSVPTGLTATAVSCSQINLSWNASTDTGGSGLKGYNIYRNGAYLKQVLAPLTTTTDTGLNESTTYSYTVSAVDNAGNQSTQSTALSATTLVCGDSPGLFQWSHNFSNTNNAYGQVVAYDTKTGNVIVAGYFTGTVDFGGGPVTSSGTYDIYVAAYSSSGTYQWAKRFGNTGSNFAYGVAVDGNSNVFVTGKFQGTVDFGKGPLTSAGNYDIFVAKYSSSGATLWAKRLGSSSDDVGYGITVDGNNNVLLTGYFNGTVDFGGGSLTSYSYDTFVAEYSGVDGSYLWAKNFVSGGYDMGYGIATDASSNVFVVGSFTGAINFGGSNLYSAGGYDIFLVKLGSNGAHLWSKRFGGAIDDYSYSVAVDSSNNVVITGLSGPVDFGGGSLPSVTGQVNAFLAKFSGLDSSYLWAKGFVCSGSFSSAGNGVAVDKYTNDIVVTGTFHGTLDFGGGPLTSVGNIDIFIAKYSSAGSHLWSKNFGYVTNVFGEGVAMDGGGNALVTGEFQGTVDFGGGPQTSANGSPFSGSIFDIFLVKFGQ